MRDETGNLSCEYPSKRDHDELAIKCTEVGAMLGEMINHQEKFLIKPA